MSEARTLYIFFYIFALVSRIKAGVQDENYIYDVEE